MFPSECRILPRGAAGIALALSALAAIVAPAPAQDRPAEAPAASAPKKPGPLKAAGGPLRLALLTVRTNTPIAVEAYARFCEAHGKDKLALDLWVQEDWAEDPRPLDFQPYDMILALRCSIPGHEKAVADAAKGGTWVVATSTTKYGDAAITIDDATDLAPYYRLRGTSNMVGLLEKACELYGVPGIKAPAPKEMPTAGIYHPDADRIFMDIASYREWYARRPGIKPEAPLVGLFLYNTLYLNEEFDYLAQLVREVEAAGAIPVLGFEGVVSSREDGGASTSARPKRGGEEGSSAYGSTAPSKVIPTLFEGVDVLLTSAFRLMPEKARHADALRALDVPVLNSVILNISREEWQKSGQGIPSSYLLVGVVTPELSGLIDPAVIATRQGVTSPATGQVYHRTVLLEENFRRQIRRGLAWSRLRRAKAAERRVAALYYNHAGGKQAVGASYLNVTDSLSKILGDLKGRGYKVEGEVERRAVIDSMLGVGRNAGSWAPGEVDRLVASGAVLWPLESYLAHFDCLPSGVKAAMTRQWGQPPGDVMTVTREGRRYFVLPAFVRGNVLCAPQLARAIAARQDSAYHDPQLWPTHQYLAFYLWLKHEWKADAVVHLGRHGTLEFLPGKSNGLSAEDPPAFVLGDLPNINPYIVDGIGEAVAAKRRGGAVLVTHATPPITETKLYGDLSDLRRKLDQHAQARRDGQDALGAELIAGIAKSAQALGFPAPATGSDPASIAEDVDHWLEEVEAQRAPRGLHTFGEGYSEESVRDMLPRMFADEWGKLGLEGEARDRWLSEVTRADSASPPAIAEGDPKSRIAATAWSMRHNAELDGLARALEGRYLEVGPPGDPLSNPAIFPTGRNQHQTDPAKIPSREAWAVGARMAEQTIELHRRKHGKPPEKLGVTLWANTLIRSQGALEAQVLHLLGVEPVWNSRGDVTDVKLVEPLGRPRVDVVLTLTGMYRDNFGDKALLLDKAVRLAAAAAEAPESPNFVARHSDAIARELSGRGIKGEEARKLSRTRIFGAEPGKYGSGLERVPASEGWADRGQIAGDYIDRMGFTFSGDSWARPEPELFRSQLKGIEAVIHGRSSNLYGIMDITENYEFQGGMSLAVEQVDGKAPDLYVDDLVTGRSVRDAREAVLASRYHNPDFIRSM